MIQSTMTLQVEDFTGQLRRKAGNIPRDAMIGDVLSRISQQMQLPDQDAQGRPILYGARTSDGEALNATDRVGDVLEENELITLTRSVTAG